MLSLSRFIACRISPHPCSDPHRTRSHWGPSLAFSRLVSAARAIVLSPAHSHAPSTSAPSRAREMSTHLPSHARGTRPRPRSLVTTPTATLPSQMLPSPWLLPLHERDRPSSLLPRPYLHMPPPAAVPAKYERPPPNRAQSLIPRARSTPHTHPNERCFHPRLFRSVCYPTLHLILTHPIPARAAVVGRSRPTVTATASSC